MLRMRDSHGQRVCSRECRPEPVFKLTSIALYPGVSTLARFWAMASCLSEAASRALASTSRVVLSVHRIDVTSPIQPLSCHKGIDARVVPQEGGSTQAIARTGNRVLSGQSGSLFLSSGTNLPEISLEKHIPCRAGCRQISVLRGLRRCCERWRAQDPFHRAWS